MKTFAIITLSFILTQNISQADNSDDSLKRGLSKSDLVASGTIVSEPMGIISEAGVPNYICQFKVSNVCKGDAKLKGKTIKVNIKCFEMNKKDHHPLIKKDTECILFLKQESESTIPQWTTTDFWFGVQHPFPWLVKSLKRLAKQENDKVEPSN